MKKALTVLKCTLALALLVAIMFVISADIFNIRIDRPTPNTGTEDPDTGGASDGPSDDGTDQENRPFPEQPDVTIPNWSIEPTVIKNALTDASGKILCETRYSYPSASSNDGSDIAAFSQALDRIATEVRLYVEARSALYKAGSSSDFAVPPQITGHYTINRFSSELFSLSFIFSEISPEGTVSETRMNYNIDILLAPDTVTIDAIMNDAISSVKSKLVAMESSGAIDLHESYDKLLTGMIDDVWWASASGLVFSFPGGTIAPASYGRIDITVDRSELSSLLSEYGKILLNITE